VLAAGAAQQAPVGSTDLDLLPLTIESGAFPAASSRSVAPVNLSLTLRLLVSGREGGREGEKFM